MLEQPTNLYLFYGGEFGLCVAKKVMPYFL